MGMWRTDYVKFWWRCFGERFLFRLQISVEQRPVASGSPPNDSRLIWRQAFQEKSKVRKMLNVRQHGVDLPDADMIFFSLWIPLPVADY